MNIRRLSGDYGDDLDVDIWDIIGKSDGWTSGVRVVGVHDVRVKYESRIIENFGERSRINGKRE